MMPVVETALPLVAPTCHTRCQVTTIEYCSHRFRIGGFMVCPFCRPAEAAAAQGEGSTPIEIAVVANRRKASANLGVQRPRRTLDLAGKMLAGCAVGKMAADATRYSRFHAVMACGHAQIVGGSDLTAADRAGRILKCTACSKADFRALRKGAQKKRRK